MGWKKPDDRRGGVCGSDRGQISKTRSRKRDIFEKNRPKKRKVLSSDEGGEKGKSHPRFRFQLMKEEKKNGHHVRGKKEIAGKSPTKKTP